MAFRSIFFKIPVFLGLAFWGSIVSAQSSENEVAGGQQLFQVFWGLALVVVLILGLAWVLKWSNRITGFNRKKIITVVSQSPVGVKEKLAVVEVGDKHLLLGLTPNNISLLHTFEKGELSIDEPSHHESAVKANQNPALDYSKTFQEVLRKLSTRSQ